MELVRSFGDNIFSTMLMVPTVSILEQMIEELDENSWLAQANR